jgi:hypothetical protein
MGVGLKFPRADRPIAVGYSGYPVVHPRIWRAAHARVDRAPQIVDLAKLGERDPQRLADGALARFKL